MEPEKIEDGKPENVIDERSGEHPNDEADIGGTQSNAGTLGLSQPERKKRFKEGVTPKESIRLKRSVTSMRGDKEPENPEPDSSIPGQGETVED